MKNSLDKQNTTLTSCSEELPNRKTLKAFKEAEDISNGISNAKRYKSSSELREDLGL